MDQVDGQRMRYLEKTAREIGQVIGRAISRVGHKYGFALFLFSFNGPELTYISNGQREDMIKVCKEFIARQEKGEADQLRTLSSSTSYGHSSTLADRSKRVP